MDALTDTDPGRRLRANAHHLYFDVLWYAVLAGSSIAFLGVYAARLGASELQVGLLTAGPAVVNLLISLPAGRWLEGKAMVRSVLWTAIAHRAAYAVLLVLPILMPAARQVHALVVLSALMSVPGTVLAIAFNALLADLVPPDLRAHVVGRRNALLAVALSGTSIACGLLLDQIGFPHNYQVVFALGFLGAALSSYHLGRLQSPLAESAAPSGARPMGDAARPGLVPAGDAVRPFLGLRLLTRRRGRSLIRPDILRGRFGGLLGAYLVFYSVQYLPIPLFPLFWVDSLALSDGAISIGNALFYVGMLLASLFVRRVADRHGHQRMLAVSAMFYGAYPLLNGLGYGAEMLWVASAVGGWVTGFLSAGLLNRLMERVPVDDRPAHMALHNLVLNLGILTGSLLGPALAQAVGLRTALLVDAGLRFLAGGLFWLLG
ncbi:MAG: hypothetical protein A2Y93_02685 [Chloroflexi bacterium RBG_13_68_17]|nr:MAG: hypothetical protein A2Y93_02685 [Chloroflexi bacterium RBG_13_68_17]